MKILLPFISRTGLPIDSPIITGGIEKFSKSLIELFPDEIIPVVITNVDRQNKRSKAIFWDAIYKHKPDFILLNDIDSYFFQAQIKEKIPTISIIHEPLLTDIRYLALYENLHKFIDSGGHLYFVSENQLQHFQQEILRVTKKRLSHHHGFINPAYCAGSESVGEKFLYDALTIGRCDVSKNPFLLHEKLQNTGLKTCVLTTEGHQKNEAQVAYYKKNLDWIFPNITMRGLSHAATMNHLKAAKCFVSTFPKESWGITALEALSHGVPVILVTDKTGEHSSMNIAASPDHYRVVHRSIKPNDLKRVVNELSAMPIAMRQQMSQMTKAKHSVTNFQAQFRNMFDKRMANLTKQPTHQKKIERPMPDDFAVFILSHKRADKLFTYRTLRSQGYTGKIFVVIDDQDPTAKQYLEQFGKEVVVFSKQSYVESCDLMDNDTLRNVVVYARNANFDLARQLGIKYFLQLDDDYQSFDFRFDDQLNYFPPTKRIKNLDAMFEKLLTFYKQSGATAIAMAQGGDFIGGSENTHAKAIKTKRKVMNSFFCSTEKPFKFIGRINEDVNTYALLGHTGHLFLTLYQVSLHQTQTQKSSGGLTDAYLEHGTYKKSFYSVMAVPSAVRVAVLRDSHKRIHHLVKFNHCVPKILPESVKKNDGQ